jgi:hypothetical protein
MIENYLLEAYTFFGMNIGIIIAIMVVVMQRIKDETN